MSAVIVLAYALGGLLGYLAARIPALGRVWPKIVRAQLLAGAIALSIVAVWRITGLSSVLWSLVIAVVCVLIFGLAWVLTAKEPGHGGKAALESWAAAPNTNFWVIPISAAVGGPVAATTAVIVDRLSTPVYAVWTWLLRRDAPVPQRKRSSWIDQAPVLALLVGLALRIGGPAPEWTAWVTMIASPLLALSGAAVFVGSALHPTQQVDSRPGVRRWLVLTIMRVGYLVPVFFIAPDNTYKTVALLYALTIPAFLVSQLSTVYGYSDPVVAAGRKWGWVVGGAGLAALIAWHLTGHI